MGADAEAAAAVASGLRRRFPHLVIAFGGSAAPVSPDDARTVRLSDDVSDAVGQLRRALRSVGSTPPVT
jgi:hypothetical protein